MGAVGAAPLDQFGRRTGEDALAAATINAFPVRQQEGHVEAPGALLVGVLEAHPFVGIGRGQRRSRHPGPCAGRSLVAVPAAAFRSRLRGRLFAAVRRSCAEALYEPRSEDQFTGGKDAPPQLA